MDSQPPHVGLGPDSVMSLPLPPVSELLVLSVLSIGLPSVQLVFRWFSRMIVLKFSCNSDALTEGGEHSLHLHHHLD